MEQVVAAACRTEGVDVPGGKGDRRERFERIYEVGYEPILAFALRRTATPEDAADVVAETFLTAWRRLAEVPDHRRLGCGCTPPPGGSSPTSAGGSAVTSGWPPGCALPGRSGRALPTSGSRSTTGELAWVLGCRPGTARVRLHRARRRFASELVAEGLPMPETGRRRS